MTIALIACSKSKLDHAAPAGELYTGSRFLLAKAWTARHDATPYVLSAKHGLVAMDKVLEPYDESLSDKTPEERDRWAANVSATLSTFVQSDDTVTVLAEDAYSLPLLPYMPHASYPLRGLDEDQQKEFLSA